MKIHSIGMLLLGIALLGLTGCAIGNKYDLTAAQPQFSAHGTGKAAVGVLDQRPYILDDDKDPDFIGLQRGGFGNPFDVTTKSGLPMGTEFATILKNALTDAGYLAVTIDLPHTETLGSAKTKILAASVDRSMLLEINEWKSDSGFSLSAVYNLHLTVFRPDGKTLASETTVGHLNLGSPGVMPESTGQRVYPEALSKVLTELLQRPSITTAMATTE